MKKLLAGLLAGCVIGVACVVLSDVYMNAGKDYFMHALDISGQWAAQLRSESDEPCYIMEGSSDVRMGIDPESMKDENGLRVINAGVNAGTGENINMVEALRMSRPGDTMVSFPLPAWKPSDDNLPGGVKFLFHQYGFRAFEPEIVDLNARHLLYIVRGNTHSFFLHLGKIIMGVPTTYKYDRIGTTHESGWTELRLCQMNSQIWKTCELGSGHLQINDNIRHLPFVKRKCAQHGLSLVVQLPRHYCDDSYRAQGAYAALYLVSQGIDVLRDPALGVETDISLFADTDLHHNAQGAQAYSRTLARLLAGKEYWTEPELVEILRSYGWNEDGTRLSPAPESPNR